MRDASALKLTAGIGLVLAALLFSHTLAHAQDEILPIDPHADLIDLHRLSHPLTGRTGQTGSWDRTGGNGDASFWYYLRAEPRRVVLADLAGPGCVARIWTTAFDWNTARIEIFIDGSATPAVSAYMRDFFGSGSLPPFVPPLSTPSTGSWVSYVPIPYQRSCRIEVINARQDDLVIYYNVTYRQYPAGATIPEPFQMPPTANQQAALDAFAAQWAARGQDPKPAVPGEQLVSGPHFILRDQKATLAGLPGAGVVTGIRLAVDANNANTLPETRIQARWDGSPTYAIDGLTGSFFGSTFPNADAEGLPLGTRDRQFYCYLPMPYANGATIEIENTAPYDVYISDARITYVPKSPADVGRLRFHADYKEQTVSGGMPSYRLLSTTGRGHYLGCTMAIQAGASGWGILEGDEQIYVNGESTPSILGTGTEDYFNGGFYFSGGTVSLPFHGVPTLDNSFVTLSAYRLQVPDPVVFRDGCIVDMEHGGQNEANGTYQSTAYYYRDDASGETMPEPEYPPLAADAIANHDFETGFGGYNNGEADGWIAYQSRSYYGQTLCTFAESTDMAVSGTRSQKVVFPSTHPAGGDQSAGVTQQVRVSKGATYDVTARLRVHVSGSLQPGHVVARLGVNPGGNTYYDDPAVVWTDAPIATDTWHTVTTSITADGDTLGIFAGAEHRSTSTPGTATLWIDDVRFTHQTTTAPGDFDQDGDVDLADFGHLQKCFTGTAPQTDPVCQNARLDEGEHVNQNDLAVFLNCMSGAHVPADPDCAN